MSEEQVWINSRSQLTEYGWYRYADGATRPDDPPEVWRLIEGAVSTTQPCMAMAAGGDGRMCCAVTGLRSPRSDSRSIRDALVLLSSDGALTPAQRGLALAFLREPERWFPRISAIVHDAGEEGVKVDGDGLREMLNQFAASGYGTEGEDVRVPAHACIVRDSPENRARLAALLQGALRVEAGPGVVAVATRSKHPSSFAGSSGWILTDHSAAPKDVLEIPPRGDLHADAPVVPAERVSPEPLPPLVRSGEADAELVAVPPLQRREDVDALLEGEIRGAETQEAEIPVPEVNRRSVDVADSPRPLPDAGVQVPEPYAPEPAAADRRWGSIRMRVARIALLAAALIAAYLLGRLTG